MGSTSWDPRSLSFEFHKDPSWFGKDRGLYDVGFQKSAGQSDSVTQLGGQDIELLIAAKKS